MSVPWIINGFSTTLGGNITNVSSSLTLATDPTENGFVVMLIGTELIAGDKSGTTVSNLSRAYEKYNGAATAASHTAGDAIYFVSSFGAMKSAFPTKIDEVLVGTTAGYTVASAAITFPAVASAITGYNHLEIWWQARGDTAAAFATMYIQFNADNAADYIGQQLVGNNNAASATQGAATATAQVGRIVAATGQANSAGSGRISIPNYSGSTFTKNAIGQWTDTEGSAVGSQYLGSMVAWWNTTAAITAVKLLFSAGNVIVGSRFTLYGYM